MSKNKWLIVGVLILGVGLWGYIAFQGPRHARPTSTEAPKPVEKVAESPPEQEKKRLNDLFKTSRPGLTAPAESEKLVSRECGVFLSSLQSLDLSQVLQFPPNDEQTLGLGENCKTLPPELSRKHEEFKKACEGIVQAGASIQERDWRQKIGACQAALFFYRNRGGGLNRADQADP